MSGSATLQDREGRWAWWLVLALLVFVALVRWQLLDVPLERDEGEYAYAGQLLLQGLLPYEHVYNMKLPGIYGAYAVALALFGQTARGIHLGLLLVNAGTVVLLFLLTRRLAGPLAGVIAAGTFAVASLTPSVHGIYANAEHFVLLPALGGLLVLLHAVDSPRRALMFWSGVLLGLAVLMKQHGAAFALCGGLYLLAQLRQRGAVPGYRPASRAAWFGAGVALPALLTAAILLAGGAFERFWFWTVTYATAYASQEPLSRAAPNLATAIERAVVPELPLWILAGVGLVTSLALRRYRKHWSFILPFVACSLLAICPGWLFRRHYFVLLLPAVGLLAGLAVGAALDGLARRARGDVRRVGAAAALLLIVGLTVLPHRRWLFQLPPDLVSRESYGQNPFPESVALGRFIRERSDPEDRIAVLGSEPQIYFYSGRRAATGYVYVYALMEPHEHAAAMQEEMIREIEAARPRFLVLAWSNYSWLRRKTSHSRIFDWYRGYVQDYRPVALVDFDAAGKTLYYWDEEAVRTPRSGNFLVVLERQ